MQQVSIKIKDALDPEGGTALLMVAASCPSTQQQQLEIRRSGATQPNLGPNGWQDRPHHFLVSLVKHDQELSVYRAGPDIVGRILYGTVIQLDFPEISLSGRASWPDVPPRSESSALKETNTPLMKVVVDEPRDDVSHADTQTVAIERNEKNERENEKKKLIESTPVFPQTVGSSAPKFAASSSTFIGSGEQANLIQTESKVPRARYYFYRAGFYGLLAAGALAAVPAYQLLEKRTPATLPSNEPLPTAELVSESDRVIDVLQQTLLEPQKPLSPMGRSLAAEETSAEELFQRGEPYVGSEIDIERKEAIYWNRAAARLGHHDALIRLGGLMMEVDNSAQDSERDVLEGVTLLALGSLLSSRAINLPEDSSRGPIEASSRLGRWIFKSSAGEESDYALYHWISEAIESDELFTR